MIYVPGQRIPKLKYIINNQYINKLYNIQYKASFQIYLH